MKGDGEWRGRVRVDIEKFVLWGFFFFFCRILVLQPGIKPESLAVIAPSPNHWTTRDFLVVWFCWAISCYLWNIYIVCWHFISFTPYFLVEGKDLGSKWSWQAVTITCFWKQDLLEHSHSHLFTYWVRLLSSNGRVELWQRPCACRVYNIYYLAYIEKICQLML